MRTCSLRRFSGSSHYLPLICDSCFWEGWDLWTHCRFHVRLELTVSLNQSHLVWPTPAAGRSAGEKHPQTCCCRFSFASRRTISVRGMTRCFLQQQRSPLHRLLLFLHFLCSSLTPSSVFTPTWWPLHPQSSFRFNCFYQHSLSNPVWECLVSLCLEETGSLFTKKKRGKSVIWQHHTQLTAFDAHSYRSESNEHLNSSLLRPLRNVCSLQHGMDSH